MDQIRNIMDGKNWQESTTCSTFEETSPKVIYQRGRKVGETYVFLTVQRQNLAFDFIAHCEEHIDVFRGCMNPNQVKNIIDAYNLDMQMQRKNSMMFRMDDNQYDKILELLLDSMELVDPIPSCSGELSDQEGKKTIICRWKSHKQKT